MAVAVKAVLAARVACSTGSEVAETASYSKVVVTAPSPSFACPVSTSELVSASVESSVLSTAVRTACTNARTSKVSFACLTPATLCSTCCRCCTVRLPNVTAASVPLMSVRRIVAAAARASVKSLLLTCVSHMCATANTVLLVSATAAATSLAVRTCARMMPLPSVYCLKSALLHSRVKDYVSVLSHDMFATSSRTCLARPS